MTSQTSLTSISLPREKQAVVKFSNVDYAYPSGTPALFNINLEVRKGELLAILGTNGAGKSTLIRHINGLLKPTHGAVEVFGTNTRNSSAAKLSRTAGIVFQNPNNQLFTESVKSEIEFGLRNFGLSEDIVSQRTKWALETFSLAQYADRPPMELSGGEKKRLCTALVLAWDPDILILDEPTVGQDSEQKEKLVQTIRLLLSADKTVILVTHDVEFVWPLQPRVVLMSEGRIKADGSAQEILGDPVLPLKANVLPPQLVELFTLLSRHGNYPKDVYEARDLLTSIPNER